MPQEILPPLPIESGDVLRDAHISYVIEGEIAPRRDNVVLVLHSLTGSAHSALEWWRASMGSGATAPAVSGVRSSHHHDYAVLAPDLFTAFAHEGGSPPVTTRDMARVIGVLLERLRIPRVALVAGGSLGGMVALEFVATFPGRARAAAVFAAPAAQGAAAIGWVHVQREALRAAGNGAAGLALARQIAMLTYRSAPGLQQRFGRREEHASPPVRENAAHGADAAPRAFAVQAWLRAHGERLTARFDSRRYLALLDAMDSHDVGRGRGGVGERLRASGTALTGVGIPGDLFYPPEDIASWVAAAGGAYREIDSVHGHDAFLLEKEQVATLLAKSLSGAPRGATGLEGAPPARDARGTLSL